MTRETTALDRADFEKLRALQFDKRVEIYIISRFDSGTYTRLQLLSATASAHTHSSVLCEEGSHPEMDDAADKMMKIALSPLTGTRSLLSLSRIHATHVLH